jgi:hypothetical protein
MNKLKLYEEFAEDRAERRRREAFDQMDDATKKKKYSAEEQLKKIQKAFPNEEFSIADYYDDSKCVFLKDTSSLLNSWNRDSNQYNDGLDKDFARWLKKNKYEWNWHSPKGQTYWDGIQIIPEDFEGFYWYYGTYNSVKKLRNDDINKTVLKSAEKFKEITGLDVYPSEVRDNYYLSSDRDTLEIILTDKMIEDIKLHKVARQYNL